MAGGYLEQSSDKPHEQLTNREFQVFMLLARGLSVQEISRLLVLSSNTVYTFRRRIFDKMDLQTNAGLIHYAVQNNLVN
jgi:DNA-binding NarL/FixJ family response regulator